MTQLTPTSRLDHIYPMTGAGSLKRVASAVGEGSIAIAAVHQVLHE